MDQPPFRWANGVVIVDLGVNEQKILDLLLSLYLQVLKADEDPAVWRLHPPAHPNDSTAEAVYRAMVDDDLSAQRLEAIQTVRAGIAGRELDDDDVSAWIRTLNGLRLVLGVRLEVDVHGHDHLVDLPLEDSRSSPAAVYDWLGFMLEELVGSASQGFANS